MIAPGSETIGQIGKSVLDKLNQQRIDWQERRE